MSPLTRPLLTIMLVTALHGAQAIPVANGTAPAVTKTTLTGNAQPETFGASAFAAPPQSGATTHANGAIGPVNTPEPKGWLLAFALVFGAAALNRKRR